MKPSESKKAKKVKDKAAGQLAKEQKKAARKEKRLQRKPARQKLHQKAKKYAADTLLYVIGSVIYALSVNIFTAPNNIAPGGVTGIATILNYLFGLPIGALIAAINIPLMIASWRHLGLPFTIRTSAVILLVSFVIDLTEPYIAAFRGDMILIVVFGGLLSGVGLALIYMRGATTGGSEVVARLLERKFPHVPIGRLILIVDAVVIVAAAIVYKNVDSALYAMILIFVSSILMDTMIYGRRKGKLLLIITSKEKEISSAIMENLDRGVTILKGAGAFSGADKPVLLCAVRPSEVYELRSLVYDRDPAAFIMVTTADEVLGEGFKQLDKSHD